MFITFEGIEGCGKSTQIDAVARRLEKEGYELLVTREPGGTPIAEKIRNLLLARENSAMDPVAELLLYFAGRAQHVAEKIKPALAASRVVLCDRFADSTIAYQGYARGLDLALIRQLNEVATGGLTPDLTILIDLPVAVGLSRARKLVQSARSEGRFEDESLAFHGKVKEGFLKIAQDEPERVTIVDGSGEVGQVRRRVIEAVIAKMKKAD